MDKKKKDFIKNFIIFILLISLVFIILFKDQNIDDIFSVLRNTKKQYILIAILFMCGYITSEAINIKRTLGVLGEKTNILKCIKYTLLNFFFSSITPSSSGGQPMEVYYMHKENISVANGTLAVLIQLCSFQLTSFLFAIIGVIFNYKHFNTALTIFFVVGMILNLTALAIFIIAIFYKNLSTAIINFIAKIMKHFKMKNVDGKQRRLEAEVNQYQGSAEYIKNHKLIILKTFMTTIVQMLFFFSISYWIYLSFGLNGANIFKIITMQAVVFTASACIPLPGAVGVSESNFMILFSAVYAKETVTSAMLLTRGVNFYLFVLISGIVVIANMIYIKNKTKQKIEEADNG